MSTADRTMSGDGWGADRDLRSLPGGTKAAPTRWRKLPVEIEAWRVQTHNLAEVAAWCGGVAYNDETPWDHGTGAGAGTEGMPSEFPADPAEVNWGLLKDLSRKPHPLLKPGGASGDTSGLHYSIVEVLYEALTVHHLLDLIGVPRGLSLDTRDIDARTLLAVLGLMNLRNRLDRIAGWHARETGPAGTVGDYCTECGHRWPCETRRMADGTYVDDDEVMPGVV